MPFDTTLDSTAKAYLRGSHYEARLFMSTVSNTVVYSARLNGSTWLFPLATLPIDGGTGTESDMMAGMVVLCAHVDDMTQAYFRGRLRSSDGVPYVLSSGAGVLYVGQTGDLGFTDNDYLWVIRDFPIVEILPRESAGLPIPDWNRPVEELRPIISGLHDCVDFADSSSGVLELSFAPTCTAATYGSAIDTGSYEWIIPPSGVSITAGSTSTKDITVEIDPSTDEYWFHFSVSDDGGRTSIFHFKVFCHDADNMPTTLSWTDLHITQGISLDILDGAADGYRATVRAVKDVSDLLDNTALIFWTDQYYDGDAVDIGSGGNILFNGRFRSENNVTSYRLGGRSASAAFELEGPLQQLARLRFPSMYLEDAATVENFEQIQHLTVWRAVWLILSTYSTFAEVCSLEFDDTSDGFRTWRLTTQGDNLLNSIAGLTQTINAVLQDNPAAMCEVVRRSSMIPSGDRGGITTVLDLTVQDTSGENAVDLTIQQVKLVGLVKSDGGGYHPEASDGYKLTAYRGRAPNGSPLGVSGDGAIPRQVLTYNQSSDDEKAELAERTGNALAAMWSPTPIRLRLPDGYHGLTPDVQARYTLTLAASETVRGHAFTTDTYWWMSEKELTGNPQTGRLETYITLVPETSGVTGGIDNNLPQVESDGVSIGNSYPQITPAPTSSASNATDIGDWSATDSSCVDGQHYLDTQYNIGSVKTITSITIEYTATATLSATNYVLLRTDTTFFVVQGTWNTVSGSNSVTIPIGSVAAQYIEITAFGDDDGCVDTIEITGVSYNTVELGEWVRYYRAGDTSWPEWANRPDDSNYVNEIEGAFVSGTGWTHTDSRYPPTGEYTRGAQIVLSHTGMHVTRIVAHVVGHAQNVVGVLGYEIAEYPSFSSLSVGSLFAADDQDFDITLEWTGALDTDALIFWCDVDRNASLGSLLGSATFTYIELHGTGSAPTGGV